MICKYVDFKIFQKNDGFHFCCFQQKEICHINIFIINNEKSNEERTSPVSASKNNLFPLTV